MQAYFHHIRKRNGLMDALIRHGLMPTFGDALHTCHTPERSVVAGPGAVFGSGYTLAFAPALCDRMVIC